jgi:AraC-like DNA-binding protein
MIVTGGALPADVKAPANPVKEGVMLLNSARVAYAGLLGKPSRRMMGSLVVYVSLGSPFELRLEGAGAGEAELAVIPPYVPHQISSTDRLIGAIQLEPESFDPKQLPSYLCGLGRVESPQILTRVREAFQQIRREGASADPRTAEIDTFFFGQPIERRRMDVRITAIVERIKQRPSDPLDAETCAELAGLSVSRFLHLFKRELGTTFRRFRAWKRARSMLAYVAKTPNLSDFALEVGYPDATHFSHSIRTFYGLSPREIFSGSRRLAVHVLEAPAGMSVALRA